jgi:streptogramin lyase
VSITSGPDGSLWFTEYTAGVAIGRITPSGAITQYAVSLPSTCGYECSLGEITCGPDGNYTFLITLIDGGKTGPDLIRIKIWDSTTGTVIYDSQPGAPDTATPTTAIGGGNLIIH